MVYEAAPEIKAVGAGLILAAKSLKVFKKLEIEQAVMAESRMLDAFCIIDEKVRVLPIPTA